MMKQNKSLFISIGFLVLACTLYRVWEGRPFGFAPQIAMAIFAGAVIRNKKVSFLVPLVSMFLSDALYQALYLSGMWSMPGFYEGQLVNYILFAGLTVFGFFIHSFSATRILGASLAAPTTYFLLSNFLVWISGGGYRRATLLEAYADGLPFYGYSLLATVIFSALFFGGYYLVTRQEKEPSFS